MKHHDRFKQLENCLCNPLFRNLFNGQATVIMCIAVLNLIVADSRDAVFKPNIWKGICNRNIFIELIKWLPETLLGWGWIHALPSEWKVYLNRSFAPKMPHTGLKWHEIPCPRIYIHISNIWPHSRGAPDYYTTKRFVVF